MHLLNVNFENTSLAVTPTYNAHQWYMTVEQTAEAYGRSRTVIMDHLRNHADEIREGVEKGVGIFDTLGGPQSATILYREGVIKLGFFIRSPRAAAFRQFATNLILHTMDKNNVDMSHILEQMKAYEQRFDKLEDVCRGIRDEVDELRSTLNLLISEDDEKIIRELIRRIKDLHNCDGRTIVGKVRHLLNIGSIYETPDTKKVVNVLRNLLGEGVRLAPKEGLNTNAD